MNTKRKGSLAVGEAISYFVKNKMSVLIPISDCDKYDLAVDQKNGIKRIQCKYSDDKAPSGAFIVDLRTFGGYRQKTCLLYTSPSPRDRTRSRMPSSA